MVGSRWPAVRPVAEVAGVAALVAVLIGLTAVTDGSVLAPTVAVQVLTLAAAAVGTGAGILAAFAARFTGELRLRWMGAGLMVYSLVVLPAIAVAPDPDPPVRALRFVAYVLVLVLFAVSLRPPERLGAVATWSITVAGVLLALAARALPWAADVAGPAATIVVVAGWAAVAGTTLVSGLQRRSVPLMRVGLGLVVLAGVQLQRMLAGADPDDLLFGRLRLLGLLIVVVGLAELLVRTLTAVRDEQLAHQEELASAALHMARASELTAERDHELRNGLAGLAGITHLLSSPVDGADHGRLRHAVLAELGRLHTLLDGGEFAAEPEEYLVAPVLEGLVALRGERPELAVEPGLGALGDPSVLAQVVTNLLANCDRHAPGAAVTVTAGSVDGGTVVEVRDTGPGLPVGVDVFRPGVHDPEAGGSGLGLAISARLVEGEGGSLAIRTVDDPPGCLATVTLPAAARLVSAQPG